MSAFSFSSAIRRSDYTLSEAFEPLEKRKVVSVGGPGWLFSELREIYVMVKRVSRSLCL